LTPEKLTVIHAINKAEFPRVRKPTIQYLPSIILQPFICRPPCYRKSKQHCNQHRPQIFVSNETMPATEAPSTFLIPISFVRCSAVNDASPKVPDMQSRWRESEEGDYPAEGLFFDHELPEILIEKEY
jgi:hypothetical protein